MRPIANYENVQASQGFERLPAGGYIIKILSATDDPQKEYTRIVYDIFEGQYRGFFEKTDAEHEYLHAFYRSYKEKSLGMYKHFTNTLERCNPGYVWDWNETALAGKILGVVFGYEEYENNRGEVALRLYVSAIKDADAIRKGDYRVPDVKRLEREGSAAVSAAIPAGFTSIDPAELPF